MFWLQTRLESSSVLHSSIHPMAMANLISLMESFCALSQMAACSNLQVYMPKTNHQQILVRYLLAENAGFVLYSEAGLQPTMDSAGLFLCHHNKSHPCNVPVVFHWVVPGRWQRERTQLYLSYFISNSCFLEKDNLSKIQSRYITFNRLSSRV